VSLELSESHRNVIPRWRRASTTAGLGETLVTSAGTRAHASSKEVDELRRDWEGSRSLSVASDFVCAATIHGRSVEALEAAEFVLAHADRAPIPALLQARRLVQPELLNSDTPAEREEEETHAEIRVLKKAVRRDPRNVLARVDLALAYVTLGLPRNGGEELLIALRLAPDDRFVLRSAARFFTHTDEPDRGLDLLRRSSRTRTDPWLQAAELAVSAVAERRPSTVREARENLESRSRSPHELSEVAVALGTMDIEGGNLARAKRLFRQGLIDPTENSVAQAVWAAGRNAIPDVDPTVLALPRSFEAHTKAALQTGSWTDALASARMWLADQPFSSRPAVDGSYAAAIGLRNYEASRRLAQLGLLANPGDATLLNNQAFADAHLGNLSGARSALARARPSTSEEREAATLMATRGLVEYRDGNVAGGREWYEGALVEFQRLREERHVGLCLLNWAREELRVGGERGADLLTRGIEVARRNQNDPALQVVISRFLPGGEDAELAAAAGVRLVTKT
jgi:Tfp pilus assembly protein PilF